MFSIIINTSCGYLFFGEKLNYKIILGIIVTMAGIFWISLAKGQRQEVPLELHETQEQFEEDRSLE